MAIEQVIDPTTIVALIAVLSLLGCASSANTTPRCSIAISQADRGTEVILENGQILARYGSSGDKQGARYDRIVEFRVKASNTVVATALDGRHHPCTNELYTISGAEVVYDGPGRKSVRITFGKGRRVELVTIFKCKPMLRIEYENAGHGHNLDYQIHGDEYVIWGAESWKEQMGWQKMYPTLQDEITTHGSYYRAEWGDPGPLSYKGFMILGKYSSEDGHGVGLILPFEKQIRFLKLIQKSGFERWIEKPHTAYLYAVTRGADEILEKGKEIVDGRL